MKKKTKKGIALAVVAMLALCSSSANVKNTAAAGGAPVYEDGDELFVNELAIGAWCEPVGTHEEMEKYKDCGFNVLYLNTENGYNKSSLNHMVKRAEQHDLYYIIASGGNRASPVSIRKADNSKINIKDDPRFLGVMSCDEPLGGTSALIDQVKMDEPNGILQNFNTIYHYLADEYLYIKQNYGNKIFDAVVCIGYYTNEFGYGSIESMAEMVYPLMSAEDRTVSIDCYAMSKKQTYSDRFAFRFDKTRRIADNAGGAKYRIHYYGQLWNQTDGAREFTDERNISYQIYTSMVYGFNMFVAYKYGPYWNEFTPKEDFIQNYYGDTEYWWYNKLAMDEIKKYDRVYLAFADDWRGTMFVEGSQNTRTKNRANMEQAEKVEYIASHDRISYVKSTQDLLMGTFKDKDGRDGFMLANQAEVYDKIGTSVEIKFKNANKALVIVDGVEKTVDLENGVFKAELKYGGGAFVVPYSA